MTVTAQERIQRIGDLARQIRAEMEQIPGASTLSVHAWGKPEDSLSLNFTTIDNLSQIGPLTAKPSFHSRLGESITTHTTVAGVECYCLEWRSIVGKEVPF